MLEDTIYTDPDILQADYQTRRKEVLYAELLLAASAQAQGGSSASGGSTAGGTGGGFGSGIIIDEPGVGGCYATETPIYTPRGIFNFREIYDRFTRGRREIYSFDSNGNLTEDYVKNIWHGIKPCLELVFEKNVRVRVTAPHMVFPAFVEKKAAGDFKSGETTMFFLDGRWQDLKLLDRIEIGEREVWNMGIKNNHCYLPNGMAASNRKYEDYIVT